MPFFSRINLKGIFLGCVREKKSRGASAVQILKPNIGGMSETSFSSILYDLLGVFILAKTRCLELTTKKKSPHSYSLINALVSRT